MGSPKAPTQLMSPREPELTGEDADSRWLQGAEIGVAAEWGRLCRTGLLLPAQQQERTTMGFAISSPDRAQGPPSCLPAFHRKGTLQEEKGVLFDLLVSSSFPSSVAHPAVVIRRGDIRGPCWLLGYHPSAHSLPKDISPLQAPLNVYPKCGSLLHRDSVPWIIQTVARKRVSSHLCLGHYPFIFAL